MQVKVWHGCVDKYNPQDFTTVMLQCRPTFDSYRSMLDYAPLL
jgi:hypothetical protein